MASSWGHGGQKYKTCMKMSTLTSFLLFLSVPTKGKCKKGLLFLRCIFFSSSKFNSLHVCKSKLPVVDIYRFRFKSTNSESLVANHAMFCVFMLRNNQCWLVFKLICSVLKCSKWIEAPVTFWKRQLFGQARVKCIVNVKKKCRGKGWDLY